MTRRSFETILTACFIILLIVLMTMFYQMDSISAQNIEQKIKKTENPYSIEIDIDQNRLYLFKGGAFLRSYPCATGKSDTPSPIGYFKINQKSKWGEGFGGYYMGINCPWGQYGIHGTTFPGSVGYALSHGCFRMYSEDCEEVYNLVIVGTPVLIVNGVYGAFGKGFRPIGPGMYGLDVKVIQQRLKDLGYYTGPCNGQYNAWGFRSAVHRYQKEHGIIVSDTITLKMFHSLGFAIIE